MNLIDKIDELVGEYTARRKYYEKSIYPVVSVVMSNGEVDKKFIAQLAYTEDLYELLEVEFDSNGNVL